jgi:GTP cyclohydrolase IA
MKQNEILLNTQLNGNGKNGHHHAAEDEIGDNHILTNVNTPLVPNAFDKTDDEKIDIITRHMEAIMQTLGLDLSDDSLKGTPKRVAKMYVKEVFSGLNPANKPSVSTFDNKYNYNQMLVEKNIIFHSNCEHHFVPFFGHAHVAYFSSGRVIGLSKLNRLVQYFAMRPQVQERLTNQIGEELKQALQTEDVAIIVEAKHLCVASRGIKDTDSTTITSFYSGKFLQQTHKNDFLKYMNINHLSSLY